jgi:hypothetical protein
VEGVIPYPANHTDYTQRICTQCHVATLAEGAFASESIEVPVNSHQVENQSGRCLDSHGTDQIFPYPADHANINTETSLFCHQVNITHGAVQMDESGVPYIAHTLAGRDDCLLCHSTDSIVPYPFTHEGREVTKCRNCHLAAPE